MASHPPLTRTIARRLFPGTAVEVIDPLATIWAEVVHRIIGELMDLASTDQSPLHINLREEMVLELAQLQIWLSESVVKKRTIGRDPSIIDPERERIECLGPQGAGTISTTARMTYEHFWSKRMHERWKPKSEKAIEREANPRQVTLATKPVRKNHFIPRWFIRDHWAVNGKVSRWRWGSEGWLSAQRSFGEWGFRHNLYSDRLEAYFGLLEGDAKEPIQMLLETTPLNGPQRASLVGFLVIQILRNPTFVDGLCQSLAPDLAELGYQYDPDMPRKAYESLYQSNDLYNKLAHPIMWSQWAIVTAPSPIFVLPDTFGVRVDLGDGLRLIAPLTPYTLFVTLPSRETEKRIVPVHHSANAHLARRISNVLIDGAAKEFLSHPDFQSEKLLEKVSIADILREVAVAIQTSTVE